MMPHWYKLYIEVCPPCGRTRTYRVRVYGKKPLQEVLRYEYTHVWCGCGS